MEQKLTFKEFLKDQMRQQNLSLHGLSKKSGVDGGNLWRIVHSDGYRGLQAITAKKLVKDGLGLSLSALDNVEM